MRDREPGQVPTETPKLGSTVTSTYLTRMGYTMTEVRQVALTNETESVEEHGRGLLTTRPGLHAVQQSVCCRETDL
jgi:hypothetical protein